MRPSRLECRVPSYRKARGWSQAELSAHAGTSRTEISAIEIGRLVPSTSVALALARAFGCRVEDLFRFGDGEAGRPAWAWEPRRDPCPFWRATVQGRILLYPGEPLQLGTIGYDGIAVGNRFESAGEGDPLATLVVAGCDPAVRLLESEYARASGLRLLALTRSSHSALELLKAHLVHAAGVHLGSGGSRSGNRKAVRETVGPGYRLLRVARWQEGIALSPRLRVGSVAQAVAAGLRWVGREAGSGARLCLDTILGENAVRLGAARHVATDHRAVAQVIRSGFAQAGVCVRLCAEEAGLSFLRVQEEDYDLCYPVESERDPRVAALLRAVRSASYRSRLGTLSGYEACRVGETWTNS